MTDLPPHVLAGTATFPWPSLLIDHTGIDRLVTACRAAGVTYGLGAKAPSLSSPPDSFHAIDCSGFVRWALYQTAGNVILPDGSVNQHDWAGSVGFKGSSVDAGTLMDSVVRIAFLTPEAGGGVGHVAMICNGRTLESFGGHGPGRREWTGEGWQGLTDVYVLM